MMAAVIHPEDYLTEAQVLDKWPMLKASELRKARKSKAIRFYSFRSGPCYTAEQVQAYIDQTYLQGNSQCEQTSAEQRPSPAPRQNPLPKPTKSGLNSAASTSTVPTPIEAASTTLAGMTKELASSAAALLGQRIAKTPKSNSQRSSSRHQQPQGQQFPVLIKS